MCTVLDRMLSGNLMTWRQIVAIIIPILVDQAFITCFNILNTAMISSSGVAAVSAVSMVDSLNFFLVNVFVAVATGGTVVVAQYKGSGNQQMVSRSASQAISAVALLAVLIGGCIIILHTPVLNLLFGKAEPAVMDNARIYLIGSCISYPCFAIFEAVVGILRGIADTKASLMLSLVMNVSYVFFNIIFITVLNMGVTGLVISLNLARFVGMGVSLGYILFKNQNIHLHWKELFHMEFSIQKKILYIGIPFAAEQMFFHGGKILTQTFIVQLGTLSMTANAISGSMVSLFQICGNTLSLAIVTVIGQCIGHKDIQDARRYMKSFLLLASLASLVSFVVIMPFFPILVRLYSTPQEIVGDIFWIMMICGIGQVLLWPVSFITPAGLRAAGDSKFTSVASMLSMWLFRVVLGYVLGILLGFGIVGVWAAMILEWGVRGLAFWIRFLGHKWYAHKLI
ncbi:MAG: MATE family efflux transporter [Massiliimalia sp.]